MGASTWNYFVPYDSSVERALQRLRQDVFQAGKYGDGIPASEQMRATFEQMIAVSPDPAAARARMEAAIRQIDALRSQLPQMPKPASMEELLEQRAESGTHSIIDIQRVAPQPEFGAVSPMPPDELTRLFGTEKPSHQAIEEMLSDERLIDHPLVAERWQGVYFTVYADGQPAELFFVGTSGD